MASSTLIFFYLILFVQVSLQKWLSDNKERLSMCRIACTQALQEKEKGPGVYIVCACAGVSIVTGCITIVIIHGFYMMCSSTDDKRRVYDSIQLLQFFWGPPAHAPAMCTRPFLLILLKGMGTRLVFQLHHRLCSAAPIAITKFKPRKLIEGFL